MGSGIFLTLFWNILKKIRHLWHIFGLCLAPFDSKYLATIPSHCVCAYVTCMLVCMYVCLHELCMHSYTGGGGAFEGILILLSIILAG